MAYNLFRGAALIRNTASQTFADNTSTKVAFNTTDLNTGVNATGSALFTFDDANDRITVNQDGLYSIVVNGPGFNTTNISANTIGEYRLEFFVNGSISQRNSVNIPNTSGSTISLVALRSSFPVMRTLSNGDFIEMFLTQVTGASQSTNTAVQWQPRLCITALSLS